MSLEVNLDTTALTLPIDFDPKVKLTYREILSPQLNASIAKLAIMLSTEFIFETADGSRQFKQVDKVKIYCLSK